MHRNRCITGKLRTIIVVNIDFFCFWEATHFCSREGGNTRGRSVPQSDFAAHTHTSLPKTTRNKNRLCPTSCGVKTGVSNGFFLFGWTRINFVSTRRRRRRRTYLCIFWRVGFAAGKNKASFVSLSSHLFTTLLPLFFLKLPPPILTPPTPLKPEGIFFFVLMSCYFPETATLLGIHLCFVLLERHK